jgi:hypothetical protein
MEVLARTRPVFHSEADFQHALAVGMSERDPDYDVRLEYRPLREERLYLDLWVGSSEGTAAVELKYKTRSVALEWGDELFELAGHGAQPLGAYDFWKDVQRLETVVQARQGTVGYAVLLTNDSTYWSAPASRDTIGDAFSTHEGREASGHLQWASHAGAGTIRGREAPIPLQGAYRVSWSDYSRLGPEPGMSFRYVAVHVGADGVGLGTSRDRRDRDA